MSIGYQSLAEEPISSQLGPNWLTMPDILIIYNLLDAFTKIVAQSWPGENMPQVFIAEPNPAPPAYYPLATVTKEPS